MSRLRTALLLGALTLVGCGGGTAPQRSAAPTGTSLVTTTASSTTTSTTRLVVTTASSTATTAPPLPLTGDTFTATLAGAAGVPSLPDKGSALTVLSADRGRLCVEVRVREVGTVTAVHLHRAASSGVYIDLAMKGGGSPLARPQEPGRAASGRSGYWISRNCVDADPSAIRAVVGSPQSFLLDVHSAEFPDGAASGPLGA